MKNIKRFAAMAVMVLLIGTVSVSVFAISDTTPAETVAGVTNKSVEEVTKEKQELGVSYGKIAADAGKLEEFKLERTEVKKERLAEQVKEEKITQEQADEIMTRMQDRQADCDGTGTGEGYGLKANQGQKQHKQQGMGLGENKGQARNGQRLQDGTGQ